MDTYNGNYFLKENDTYLASNSFKIQKASTTMEHAQLLFSKRIKHVKITAKIIYQENFFPSLA